MLTFSQFVNPLLLIFNPLLKPKGQPLVLWSQGGDQLVEGVVTLARQQIQEALHLRLFVALSLWTTVQDQWC